MLTAQHKLHVGRGELELKPFEKCRFARSRHTQKHVGAVRELARGAQRIGGGFSGEDCLVPLRANRARASASLSGARGP